MHKIQIPIIPNSPLRTNDEPTPVGDLQLRKNKKTGFVENALFDENKIIYDDRYQNDQSSSPQFLTHMWDAYRIIKGHFSKGALLVEVGCGKGKFLDIVKEDGYFDYKGYDATYEGDDQNIEKRYLTADDALKADVVVLRHTLEHIQNPHKFLQLLKNAFTPPPAIFIEVPQFEWIEKNEVLFDFTYEHVNYFTASALRSLFSTQIDSGDFFHGQYQYILAPLAALDIENWEAHEADELWAPYDLAKYAARFRQNIQQIETVNRLWIWGGATKGVLFLNHLKMIAPALYQKICGVVDLNPQKQGCFTPITYFKIFSPQNFCLKAEEGDSVLVVNPNYLAEVQSFIKGNTAKKIDVYTL